MSNEKKIIIEASSIESALSDVSRQWQVPAERLQARVLSEQRKGFLGLGGKMLKVEISTLSDESESKIIKPAKSEYVIEKVKQEKHEPESESESHDDAETQSDSESYRSKLLARGVEFVDETLRLMNFEANSVISENAKNTLDIRGRDAQDYVVGRYGDALKGMEYLVNLALRDPKTEPRIKIDSCGYRERRTKSLERLAEATARQAIKYGRPVRLEPMASWERWVIHTTLKDRDNVSTESIGEPPLRKVVVMPKFDPEEEGAAGPATMRVRARREKVGARPSSDRQPIDRDRRRRRRRN